MSKILLENVNNKSPSAVRSGRKSCRVNMTVRQSFEEKTDDARACAQSGHCPFNTVNLCVNTISHFYRYCLFTFCAFSKSFKLYQLLYLAKLSNISIHRSFSFLCWHYTTLIFEIVWQRFQVKRVGQFIINAFWSSLHDEVVREFASIVPYNWSTRPASQESLYESCLSRLINTYST